MDVVGWLDYYKFKYVVNLIVVVVLGIIFLFEYINIVFGI